MMTYSPPPPYTDDPDLVTYYSPRLENLELISLKEQSEQIEKLFEKTKLQHCNALAAHTFFSQTTKPDVLKNWWALPSVSKAFQIMSSSRLKTFIAILKLNREEKKDKIDIKYLLELNSQTKGLNPFQNMLPESIRKAIIIESSFDGSNPLVTGIKCDKEFRKLTQTVNKKIGFGVRSGKR